MKKKITGYVYILAIAIVVCSCTTSTLAEEGGEPLSFSTATSEPTKPPDQSTTLIIPAVTPTQKPTVFFTATSKSGPTLISTPHPLKDSTILTAIRFVGERSAIVLVDNGGTVIQKILFDNRVPIQFELKPSTCELLVTAATFGDNITLSGFDINSGNERRYFVSNSTRPNVWETLPSLSPSGKWLSYLVWSGDMYYSDAQFQDIEAFVIEKKDVIFKLTKHGGAWKTHPIWAAKTDYLAYSDYDTNGVNQLYRSLPDGGDKLQLSHFTDNNIRIGPIHWYSDDNELAFILYRNYRSENKEIQPELWTVSVDGKVLKKVELSNPDLLQGKPMLWWGYGEDTVLYSVYENDLFIIDINQGKIVRKIPGEDIPGYGISILFGIGASEWIGIDSSEGIYIYNFGDNSFQLWLTGSEFGEDIGRMQDIESKVFFPSENCQVK